MASAGISFTGLGSGIDTSSIVDQLMSLEQQPITLVQQQKTREVYKDSLLTEISTRLKTLQADGDALRDPTFWAGTPKGTSGEPASYTIAATSGSAKSSYSLQVKSLATSDVYMQSATSGTRQFGPAYSGSGVFATGATTLASLTTSNGAPLGLAAGQTITLNGSQNGTPVTASLVIDGTTTLDNLNAWVQTSVPGATVSLATGGRITVKSPPGTDQELTPALSLTSGGAAPAFDAAFASSTAISSASGIGKVQANDTLHIVSGTLAFDVPVTAGMTMAQVAVAINGANGGATGAVAAGALRIQGVDTGAANTITVTSTGPLAAQLGLTRTVQAKDAVVSLDGVDKNVASNTTDDLIPGATVSLLQTSQNASTASTDPTFVDGDAASTMMKKIVDDYNSVIDYVDLQMSETSVQGATTQDDINKGTLFGSSTLISIRDGLQQAMTGLVTGLAPGGSLPSDIGISTGAIGSDPSATSTGDLQFDATKFAALFTSNQNGLKQLLTNDGATADADGLAQRISDLTDGYTRTGGIVQAEIDGSTAEQTRMQEQIDDMTARLSDTQDRLKAQFLAMETAISQLKSQSGSLSSSSSSSS